MEVIDLARYFLGLESLVILLGVWLLRTKKKYFKHRCSYRLLQIIFLSVFVWVFGIFLQLFMPTGIVFGFGSIEYFSLQVLNFSTIVAILSQYLFSRFYQKVVHLNWYDYSLICFTCSIGLLLWGPNMVSESITFLPSGNAIVPPGRIEGVFSLLVLTLGLSVVGSFYQRFRQAQNLVEQKQMVFFMWGSLIFNIGGMITNWILPAYLNVVWLDFVGPVFWVALAYAFVYFAITNRFFSVWQFLFWYKSSLHRLERAKGRFKNSFNQGLEALSEALSLDGARFVSIDAGELPELFQYSQSHSDKAVVRAEADYQTAYMPRPPSDLVRVKKELESYMIAAAIPVRGESGQVLGLLLLEQKQARVFSSQEVSTTQKITNDASFIISRERDYTKTLKSIQENQGAQQEFFKDLMHEVRHPLMIARSVPELIDWNQLKPQDQVYLKKSQESLKDLSKKLDRISDAFSWSQGAGSHLQHTRISVAELIHYLTEDLATIDDRYPEYTQITCREPELESELLYCDLQQFKQALLEVCKNAFFFSDKSPPKLEIKISQDQSDWVFEFTDNGIGIAEKYWDKIFDLMFVISESRNEKEAGIGAGLTLARGILETHQGALEIVDSQIGEGTSFEVRLPKIHC